MLGIGIACLVVAAIWIGYKVYLSYTSCGGTVIVTVYDAAAYPPMLIGFGLYQVMHNVAVAWPPWVYVAIAVACVLLVIVVIRVAERIGDRDPY